MKDSKNEIENNGQVEINGTQANEITNNSNSQININIENNGNHNNNQINIIKNFFSNLVLWEIISILFYSISCLVSMLYLGFNFIEQFFLIFFPKSDFPFIMTFIYSIFITSFSLAHECEKPFLVSLNCVFISLVSFFLNALAINPIILYLIPIFISCTLLCCYGVVRDVTWPDYYTSWKKYWNIT